MEASFETILGVWLLMFGIAKVLVGALAMTVPAARDAMAASPIFSLFVESDTSFAGVYTEIVLIAFGAYSFIHGLVLLDLIHNKVVYVIEHPAFFALINIAFAVALLGFYSLVLFTSMPISKNKLYLGHYWIGLATGITFLAVPIAVILWQAAFGRSRAMATLAVSTLALIVMTVLVVICVRIAQRYKQSKSLEGRLLTLAMVPLNAL